MISYLPYIVVATLIGIGLYGVMFRKNLIKIVIGVEIAESAVNLFLIEAGYVKGGVAPIFTFAPSTNMVLPTPQALTLTSIVIGMATTALMLAFAVAVYKNFGTLDVKVFRRLSE